MAECFWSLKISVSHWFCRCALTNAYPQVQMVSLTTLWSLVLIIWRPTESFCLCPTNSCFLFHKFCEAWKAERTFNYLPSGVWKHRYGYVKMHEKCNHLFLFWIGGREKRKASSEVLNEENDICVFHQSALDSLTTYKLPSLHFMILIQGLLVPQLLAPSKMSSAVCRSSSLLVHTIKVSMHGCHTFLTICLSTSKWVSTEIAHWCDRASESEFALKSRRGCHHGQAY